MKKVMIAFFSAAGTTQQMATYIAEGVRMSGVEVVVREISDIKASKDLSGYDGYLFGAPTYSLDVPEAMKKFLSMAPKQSINSRLGGSFGPFTHDVAYGHEKHAPAIILETLQNSLKMKPFELGPLILREDILLKNEGIRACQEYGRGFGAKLNG